MKKVFRKIHLWLSVPFGLLITLICFSGAMLVFETEVMELCHRDLYYVEKVGPAPLPMGKVAEKVAATLPDSVSVTGVTAFCSGACLAGEPFQTSSCFRLCRPVYG